MCRIEAPTLKERKAAEQKREQQYVHSLTSRKKSFERCRREKQHKKKRVDELLEMLDLKGIEAKMIRQPHDYSPRCYNLERQLVGLLRHLFVEYPVPAFLYRSGMRHVDPLDPFVNMHEMYRQWFVALAQGYSFAKLVKGIMTAKEAHAFLFAPSGGRIHENVWWAKMAVAGVPRGVADKLIDRVFAHFFVDDPNGRMAETIQFFARHSAEMDKATLGEVLDFLSWKLRNDPEFRMKGRTVGSLVKLTNEWHLHVQKARLDRFIEWNGLGLDDWDTTTKEAMWIVAELRNNRDLLREGRKQKHCVYSYVGRCVAAQSTIFSMRAYPKTIEAGPDGRWDQSCELTRITVEVSSQRSVVQIRGRLNRAASDEEMKVLRHWMGDKGLILAR